MRKSLLLVIDIISILGAAAIYLLILIPHRLFSTNIPGDSIDKIFAEEYLKRNQ